MTGDVTVKAGSRGWAMVQMMLGERVTHPLMAPAGDPVRAAQNILETLDGDTGWTLIPAIRPGQLVEWHRGEAWGVAKYVRQRGEGDTVSQHEVDAGGWIVWVERVSPAPRVDYREQVRIAREALHYYRTVNSGTSIQMLRDYAAEALRMMDGGKA